MRNYIHSSKLGTKMFSLLTATAAVALIFIALLSLADASAIDGDHMQDAAGVNSTVSNQVLRKGWGFVPGNGLFAIEDTPIDYGIMFDEIPLLIVKFANSRQVADGDPGALSDCETTRKVIAAGVNQTKSGFKPILRTPTGLGFPSTTNYCYTWMAIGRHDASYDGGDTTDDAWTGTTDVSTIAGNVGVGVAVPDERLTLGGGNLLQLSGNPLHAGSITDDAVTFLNSARSIYVSGKYAYVTGHMDAGVEILDISDPLNPSHAGGVTHDVYTGVEEIFVSGNYAYVTSGDDGVLVMDVTNPSNPFLVGSIYDNASTALFAPRGIFVVGKYAYVASYEGVEILDITNPASPAHVGSIFDNVTTELDGARDIYVSGKYAYVASYIDDGVEILDISQPALPIHVGSIADDATTALDGANSIYVSGKYAYVTAYVDAGVEVLDISDPSNPTHVGSITDNYKLNLDGASSILVSGDYAYVTGYLDDGVEVLNVSDPTDIQSVGTISDDPTRELNGAQSIFISGKYAYVAAEEDHGVEVLDIFGIDAPSASIGAISANTLHVTENAQIANNMHIDNGLKVGIGGIQSGGNLAVDGHIRVNTLASASATDLCINNHLLSSCSSSIRYKKNINSLSWGMEVVEKLKPVSFEWKEGGEKDFGFIAEEVAGISPLLVTFKDGRVEGVKYDQMGALFVNAFKEQQERIKNLESLVCLDHPGSEVCN